MSDDTNQVAVTPIVGGRNDISGACTILEIGSFTVLLDCGCSIKNSLNLLQKLRNKLSALNKTIDAVLLSHADLQHLGALPVVFGKNGISNATVICTLPVHKFGQLVLYDHCANKEMEGGTDRLAKTDQRPPSTFDYDDIDECFLKPTIVKFSQTIQFEKKKAGQRSIGSTLSVSAHPSGRTIGGSIWRIRLGSTEIVYMMDIAMKNELVLAGASIDALPTAPSLLILDAGTSSQYMVLKDNKLGGGVAKKKKDKDDPNGLIESVMETLRKDGNVLIPCETAGRTLELFQLFSSHWLKHKIGLYHLVFLSPMAHNVLEFARSQLEWMSDSLSKSFYNGAQNPFELKQLKVCTSIKELERSCNGPKLVLSTDASLSCGLSKELLLRWGGDPRCRVIFTDMSDQASLAQELRTQSPPVVATVTTPRRVELTGDELKEYRLQEERRRLELEEEALVRKRETELESLALAVHTGDGEDDGRTDPDSAVADEPGHWPQVSPDLRRADSSDMTTSVGKRRKSQSSALLSRFSQPSFPVFQSRETEWRVDEYGASIDDLKFPGTETNRILSSITNGSNEGSVATQKRTAEQALSQRSLATEVPTKVITAALKVQFTCSILEIPAAGRSDLKLAKFLLTKIAPARVVVLRGSATDCDSLISHAKAMLRAEAHSPFNGDVLRFKIPVDRVRLQIPPSLMPRMLVVRGISGITSLETECALASIVGSVVEVVTRDSSGLRTLRLQPATKGKYTVKLSQIGNVLVDQAIPETIIMSSGDAVHNVHKTVATDEDRLLMAAQGQVASLTIGDAMIGINGGSADVIETTDASCSAVDDFLNSMFGGALSGVPVEGGMSLGLFGSEAAFCTSNFIDDSSNDTIEMEEDEEYVQPLTTNIMISVGEMTLPAIKGLIEVKSLPVELRLSSTGAVLICDGQVIIRKVGTTDGSNEIVIEGPPVRAFWEAKKAVHDRVAFVG